MSDALRVAVIGAGYWGPNLIRNLVGLEGVAVVAVVDLDRSRLQQVGRHYPAIELSANAAAVIERDDIDAVVIATPLSTHYQLASWALSHGKHVWLEKPLAPTVPLAERLVALAKATQRVLMVDHTFVYTGAVRTMQTLIASGELGDLYYFDAVRVNLGQFQQDVNVLWDLGPHDLSIMAAVLPAAPVAVSAIGAAPIGVQASMAYVSLWLADGMLAHLHLNWLSPVKVRRTLIGGSRRMIVYDALDPDNQVKVYDRGVDAALAEYRSGDMVAPKVDQTEALAVACAHFANCIRNGHVPTTDGDAGLAVVRILSAAQQSMDEQGRVVQLGQR